MKSERRHELGHNQLADWLAKQFEVIKPHLNTILGGLLLIAVVAAVALFWSNRSTAATAKTWESFYAALGDQNELAEFAEKHITDEAGQLAAVCLGDIYLSESGRQIFKNKVQAISNNGKAIEQYKACLSKATKPTLRQRATFGLARAQEVAGEIKTAIGHYEEIVQKWPDSLYATYATERLRDLKKDSTKEMYDWLAQYEPKPASATDFPRFDPTVPGEPPTAMPRPGTPVTTHGMGLEGPSVKPTEEPKSPEAAPLVPKPAEDKKPAEEKKPEADKPEGEKKAEPPKDDKPADAPPPDEKPMAPEGDKPE